MKKLHLLSVLVSAVLAAGLIFGGCQNQGQEAEEVSEKTRSLTILYPNWAEGIAITHLAKVALTDKGYAPTIKPIEPGPIYASLAKGDCELFLDAWLPHTHQQYWEKFGQDIVKIGESFSNGTTGLVVPAYVEESSILDLQKAEVADKFEQKIYGIGSGAGIHKNTLKTIEAYDLPFKQVTSSGPAMIAALEKAYNKKEPIIVTGWKPHFMWNRFDLKYLADPKDIYPKDVMAILARQGFKADFPKLADFFSRFNFPEQKLYDLMDTIKNSPSPEEGAKKWYEENKAMVNQWWQ